MTASNQMTETENTPHPAAVPIDPFAVDFFGGPGPHAEEGELFPERALKGRRHIKVQKKSDWYKNLPQITNAEAEFSNLLSNWPENLTGTAARAIAETLARYTFRPADNIECSILSLTEVNLSQSLSRAAETSQIFLTIGGEPDNSLAAGALNFEFARSLIDSMLGGKGTEFGNLREFSPIETTIVEFLAANILSEINNFLGEPLFVLRAVGSESPNIFDPFERGAEIVFNLELGDFKGLVKMFAPQKFLNIADKTQNPLLIKKSGRKKLSDFEKIAPRLDLRLQIGTTFLDADSFSYLEPGDIVLIDQPQIGLENENLASSLQVFVGRARNVRMRGMAEANGFNGNLIFRIDEILSEETRRRFTPVKFKMDEKENELAEETNPEGAAPIGTEAEEDIFDEQLSPALENIQVALRVEIAGNKISLRELQNLRAGQIIALGCSPTDPVRLVTDSNDEPVATGDLVEIEGQLGVRLTKVFI
jgi:flagellar motor switch protein FliM